MRRVVLESPFAGDVAENIRYAKLAMKDCLQKGDAPIASHLLWTQEGLLDDTVPGERALGIEAGLTWTPAAEAVVAYIDRGISNGMKQGMARAEGLGIPVEIRTIPTYLGKK